MLLSSPRFPGMIFHKPKLFLMLNLFLTSLRNRPTYLTSMNWMIIGRVFAAMERHRMIPRCNKRTGLASKYAIHRGLSGGNMVAEVSCEISIAAVTHRILLKNHIPPLVSWLHTDPPDVPMARKR